MASNSIAEQIIQNIVTTLEAVESLKSVARQWPTMDELKRTAITMLPRVAVVHNLPSPIDVTPTTPGQSRSKSALPITLYLYFQSAKQSETALSLVDDIWAALLVDRERGGLAIDTTIKPKAMGDFAHIVACKIDVSVTYLHMNTSI